MNKYTRIVEDDLLALLSELAVYAIDAGAIVKNSNGDFYKCLVTDFGMKLWMKL